MQQQRGTRWILGLMVVCVVTTIIVTTGPSQAASGNGPYYAEPSWDQKLPAATRFVVLTDWNSEAVLDRNTGLVWEKSPDTTTQTWGSARFTCINKSVGGQKGWRLPAIAELTSLIDPAVAFPGPTLPAGHPFTNVQSSLSSVYWSASTNAENPTDAWFVIFFDGNVDTGTKASTIFAWCVRGGSNADVY